MKMEELVLVNPPSLKHEQKCEKHEGQLIHSYLICKIKKSQKENYKHTLLCT